jgi:capsular polysaccharide transport system ATP-binding protein
MIVLEDVSKIYRARNLTKTVFTDVNLRIGRGDALALIGANGAGKSTLMRIISGIEHATSGRVDRGGFSISWPIGYTSCFQSSLTGADNARFIARIYRRDFKGLLAYVEDFAQLGPYLHQPIRTYSAGMSARLAFGISLAIEFDCYLVDEVTGAGDERFRQRCHEAIMHRRDNGTLVMASHDPNTLREYCTTAAVVRGGKVVFYDDLEAALSDHQSAQRLAA